MLQEKKLMSHTHRMITRIMIIKRFSFFILI